MELSLFGGFRCSERGTEIPVPDGTARVLALLALMPRRRAHRERLAGTLWPDVARDRSLANLRSALWRVPKDIRFIVDPAPHRQIALKHDVTVDVDLLYTAPPEVPPIDAISGELLAGWYDDWVIAERERLELRRISLLERIASEHLSAGEYSAAIDLALQAIGADPYRESLHRIVLAAHEAEGNHSEALRHYHRLCDLLERALGARPSEATAAVITGSTHAQR